MHLEQTCLTQDLNLTLDFAGMPEDYRPSAAGYQLESRIGRGSFGEIWRARQQSTGRLVAVKFFPSVPQGAARELEKLTRIGEHPQVVTLIDAQLEGADPYIVMPLLQQSLGAHYRALEVRALEPAEGLRLMTETCRGLVFVHRRGLLHGDLKPDNILLDGEGRARLADFGQSQLFGEGAQLGTLMFMPPGQIQACLTPKSQPFSGWDLYALGASFYFLLSGEYPRLNERDRSKLALEVNPQKRLRRYAGMLLNRKLKPLCTLNPRISSRLALIIERCLELRDQRCYQSAADILSDLQLIAEVPFNLYDECNYRLRSALNFIDFGWLTGN